MTTINIINLDFSVENPISGFDKAISEFRSSEIKKVPIIRIFGSTTEGKKCCAYVHGVYPYFYIPYDGLDNSNTIAYQLAIALDKTLNIALNKASSTQQHVYNICLVSAIPFYGYHRKEHLFFKIYFYNPMIMRKAATLLQSGNILGKIFQTHESHIPFIQQFMIDYNLFGMNFIRFSEIHLRDQCRSFSEEFDVFGKDILNRLEVTPYNVAMNPGIKFIQDEEIQRRLKNNEDILELSANLTQNRANVAPTASHCNFLLVLEKILAEKQEMRENSGNSKTNDSVYAAETPDSQEGSLLSASDNTMDCSNLDVTLMNDQVSSEEVVLCDEALSLLNSIIKDEEEKDLHNEFDSLLSQLSARDFEGNQAEENEEEEDLNMTMQEVLDSTQNQLEKTLTEEEVNEEFDFLNDSIFIPQVDGANDEIRDSMNNDQNVKVNEGRFISNLSQKSFGSPSKRKKRSDKALLSDISDIRYPVLNVTIGTPKTLVSKNRNETLFDKTKVDEFLECEYKQNADVKEIALISTKNESDVLSRKTKSDKNINSRREINLNIDKNFGKHSGNDVIFRKVAKTDCDIDKCLSNDAKTSKSTEFIQEKDCNVMITPEEADEEPLSDDSLFSHHFSNLDENSDFEETTSDFIAKSKEVISLIDPEEIPHRKNEQIFHEKQSKTDLETEILNDPSLGNQSQVEPLSCESIFSDQSDEYANNAAFNYDLKRNIFPQAGTSKLKPKTPSQKSQNFTKSLISNLTLYIPEECNKNQIAPTQGIVTMAPKYNPPSRELIEKSLLENPENFNANQSKAPFYSNAKDVTTAVDIGHNTLLIKYKNHHETFSSSFGTLEQYQKAKFGAENAQFVNSLKMSHWTGKSCFIAPVKNPPSYKDVKRELLRKMLQRKKGIKGEDLPLTSESCSNSLVISGNTLNNTHGFKMTLENYQEARALSVHQYVTTLSLEVHAENRGVLKPDPKLDPIKAIFYALYEDFPSNPTKKLDCGFIYVNDQPMYSPNATKAADETDLFGKFLERFCQWNPDILVGFEIEANSWGYLIERALALNINLLSKFSRMKDENLSLFVQDPEEDLHTTLKITGRIILDLWRILRHEIALQSYTFENLAFHVLHERISTYPIEDLTRWYRMKHYQITLDHYLYRVEGSLRLMDHYDLINRTSELAKLFGITFYEVLSRGSQFRVESMMLRLAKPYNYIPVSPNQHQRAHMKAPEFIPLVLEPESKFYKDPVIVLDFQSLYPSIMIAYNYCFSTCVGKIRNLGTDDPFEFGAYQLKVPTKTIKFLLKKNLLNVSPSGSAFVKESQRKGILPRMLQEILDTRLMVKKAMKKHKDNKTLQKVLHARQLGLKLIANVTYGYTAANYSGRMACVEVADSVVSKGRETLQRAIALVENTEKWKAKVVYGDTDSLFVLTPGRTTEEAFKIGEEIAEAVTNDNPSPVRLKLEKVYVPCILQTKKRYVGYLHENAKQEVPDFEAKGIETVRRDGCPAASKMLEKTLKILFDTRDVSLVKNYVQKQFAKIISGRISIQELTFAKEYRGKSGYKASACVPALELTKKWLQNDKRNEPRTGERVPYVIINGAPGLPLIRLVRHPLEVLKDPSLTLNATYYLTKAIIPPLNRCFKLIGADLFNWLNEMPKRHYQPLQYCGPSSGPKSTIIQYFSSRICAACGCQTQEKLCQKCLEDEQKTYCILNTKISLWERKFNNTQMICKSCCGRSTDLNCISLDCPVLYRLAQSKNDKLQADFVRTIMT